MHDFIWVLFTDVFPSHVVRALVQLSENLVGGTRRLTGMSTSAQIYPHSSDCSLRYVLISGCHPTSFSSPHIAAYAQCNDPASSDRTGNIPIGMYSITIY